MKRQLIRTEGGGLYSASSINNKNKTVECFPSGGGFVRTIPFSKIVDFDAKPTEIYKKVVVGFRGIHQRGYQLEWLGDTPCHSGRTEKIRRQPESASG
jgi:hypothetical protein